jgi:hypothetical protein
VILNLMLWAGGVALLAAGIVAIRTPLARYRDLREREANLKRYDSWRGGWRSASAAGERTGADVMIEQMRRKVILWSAVIATGIVLIVAGFLIR